MGEINSVRDVVDRKAPKFLGRRPPKAIGLEQQPEDRAHIGCVSSVLSFALYNSSLGRVCAIRLVAAGSDGKSSYDRKSSTPFRSSLSGVDHEQ